MSKRRSLAHLLDRTGTLRAILALRARASPSWLGALAYHRVATGVDEPFDSGVIDVTPEEFDRQIATVKRHFNVVGIDELCAFSRGEPLPPNPVAITFDDGYLDSYVHALPILKRHGVKAIFFVPTSFITERRVFWWDRAAYVLKRSQRERIRLEYPVPLEIDLTRCRAAEIHRVLRIVKHHPTDFSRFLGELESASGVPWDRELEREAADRLLMTWDHVRLLRESGMDIGSHTRTHRVLQTLPTCELADELAGSRLDIERELGTPVRSIAYPVGKPLPQCSPIRIAIAKAGYQLGFTNCTGATPLWNALDPFNISRQSVERDLTDAYLLSMLAVPFLAPKYPWDLAGGGARSSPLR